MKVPLVDLKAQYLSIKTEIDTAIQDVLNNTDFIMGERVKKFETQFAKFCTARHAIGVSNGTTAIKLCLSACGVKDGDEVITPTHTFAATAEAIFACRAKPIFVDIDEKTFNINPDKIEAAITSKTKAILPVHLYGQPCDMAKINKIAKQHNLKVIEDSCQSHGAECNGKRTGTLGDVAAFSFFPGKNLGAYGDAGSVTTNDDKIAENVRLFRDHGRTDKYVHTYIGMNERIDALQASILSVKMNHIDKWTEQRREKAKVYNNLFKGSSIITPFEAPYAKHVYHLYVVRIKNRDAVLEKLKKAEIGAGVHYPIPLHLQPAFKGLGYKEGDFPVTEKIAKEILSIPLYPEITGEQMEFVAKTLKEAIRF